MAKNTNIGINIANVKSSVKAPAKEYKRRKHHVVLGAIVGGLCLKDINAEHKYKKAVKRLDKIKSMDEEYAAASKYFYHGPGGEKIGNVFADALHRNLSRFESERDQRLVDRYRRHLETKQKLGNTIGGALRVLNNAARTLQMKNMVTSESGKTSGINREAIPGKACINKPVGTITYDKDYFAGNDDFVDDFEIE